MDTVRKRGRLRRTRPVPLVSSHSGTLVGDRWGPQDSDTERHSQHTTNALWQSNGSRSKEEDPTPCCGHVIVAGADRPDDEYDRRELEQECRSRKLVAS